VLTTSKEEEDKVSAYNLNVAGYIVKKWVGDEFLNLISMINPMWKICELQEGGQDETSAPMSVY
jgi:hypothetical protein